MSTYASISGELRFPSLAKFMKARKVISPWLNEDNMFTDECGSVVSDEPAYTDAMDLTIKIPGYCYRNMCRVLEDLTRLACRGWVYATCTDGDFWGWVWEDGKAADYPDLAAWAKEKGIEGWAPGRYDAPNDEDEAGEDDTEEGSTFDIYLQWLDDIQDAFTSSGGLGGPEPKEAVNA